MKINPDKLNSIQKVYREIGPYIGLGTQLAVTVTLMFFLGRWLDDYFDNSSPILTIIFLFFGVFAGMYSFIKSVLKSGKND